MIKKLFIFIIIMSISPLCLAVINVTKIVAESGGDYPDLATAEAAWDFDFNSSGEDTALTLEIQGTWTSAESGGIAFDGASPTATGTYTVTATGSARAPATGYSTTAYRAERNLFDVITINDNYITIDGIQIKTTGTLGSQDGVNSNSTNTTVKNCFLISTTTGAFNYGVIITGATALVYNNIMVDFTRAGAFAGSGDHGYLLYNNTIIGGLYGAVTSFLDCKAINNIFWGQATATSTGTLSNQSSNNATDNATCTDCGANSITNMSDPFISIGSDDYHLANGTSDPAGDGIDLSGIVDDDIDGDDRPNPPSIGADEFVGGEPPEDEASPRRRKLLNNVFGGLDEKISLYYFGSISDWR